MKSLFMLQPQHICELFSFSPFHINIWKSLHYHQFVTLYIHISTDKFFCILFNNYWIFSTALSHEFFWISIWDIGRFYDNIISGVGRTECFVFHVVIVNNWYCEVKSRLKKIFEAASVIFVQVVYNHEMVNPHAKPRSWSKAAVLKLSLNVLVFKDALLQERFCKTQI